MESAVPDAAGNKLLSDKNMLLVVLQLLRKYNLKVEYFLGYETSITYLLTPWSGVFIEKLTGFHLVNKFSTFYGTRRFITAVTSARHLPYP